MAIYLIMASLAILCVVFISLFVSVHKNNMKLIRYQIEAEKNNIEIPINRMGNNGGASSSVSIYDTDWPYMVEQSPVEPIAGEDDGYCPRRDAANFRPRNFREESNREEERRRALFAMEERSRMQAENYEIDSAVALAAIAIADIPEEDTEDEISNNVDSDEKES